MHLTILECQLIMTSTVLLEGCLVDVTATGLVPGGSLLELLMDCTDFLLLVIKGVQTCSCVAFIGAASLCCCIFKANTFILLPAT